MFPLTSNEAYIKSTGERSTLGKMLEEGGNEPIEEKLDDEIETRAALGAHNLWNNPDSTCYNAEIFNNGFKNTATDTKTKFNYYVFAYQGTTRLSTLLSGDITANGDYTFKITAPENTDRIRIAHNGSQADIFSSAPFPAGAGSYILSFKVTGFNPSTVGGLVVENIMIRLATDADVTYQPYAMTNRELTNVANKLKSSSIASGSYAAIAADTWECVTSFTLSNSSLVIARFAYSATNIKGIAIATRDDNVGWAHAVTETSLESALQLLASLAAGTWYLWVKYGGTGTNTYSVDKIMEIQ